MHRQVVVLSQPVGPRSYPYEESSKTVDATAYQRPYGQREAVNNYSAW
jgi:hypothetical protein